MIKYIKNYKELVNEHVIQLDDVYIVGGIKVKKSIITSYKRKVKEQTGKDLTSMYSDPQIAEMLVDYIIEKYMKDIETIPVSALIGGDEDLEEIPNEDDEDLEGDTNSDKPTETAEDAPIKNNAPTESSNDDFEDIEPTQTANTNTNDDRLPI